MDGSLGLKYKMNNENEVYYLLTGRWLSDTLWIARGCFSTEGRPASVNFDAKSVIEQEKTHGNVLGFYHTHPHMPATPSSIDYDTMNTWIDCLGKSLLCLIEGANGLRIYHWENENYYIRGKGRRFGNFFMGSVKDARHVQG